MRATKCFLCRNFCRKSGLCWIWCRDLHWFSKQSEFETWPVATCQCWALQQRHIWQRKRTPVHLDVIKNVSLSRSCNMVLEGWNQRGKLWGVHSIRFLCLQDCLQGGSGILWNLHCVFTFNLMSSVSAFSKLQVWVINERSTVLSRTKIFACFHLSLYIFMMWSLTSLINYSRPTWRSRISCDMFMQLH